MQIKFERRDYRLIVKEFLGQQEIQAYTMAILSFFALAFFFVFAIKPTLTTFFTLRKQIEDRKEVDLKLEDKINALLKAQEEYQKNKDYLSFSNEALPNDPQFTALLSRIEDLAKDHAITLKTLKIGGFEFLKVGAGKTRTTAQDGEEGLSYFDFTLGLSATYNKEESFLNALTNIRRIVMLDTVKFNKDQEELNLDMQAKAYYLESSKP